MRVNTRLETPPNRGRGPSRRGAHSRPHVCGCGWPSLFQRWRVAGDSQLVWRPLSTWPSAKSMLAPPPWLEPGRQDLERESLARLDLEVGSLAVEGKQAGGRGRGGCPAEHELRGLGIAQIGEDTSQSGHLVVLSGQRRPNGYRAR